jgi:hypothetical protein
MKPLLIIVSALLFVFVVIFWGAYKETQFQYNTYQQLYSKNMDCRVAYTSSSGSDYVNKVCGSIPTWDTIVYDELEAL